MFKSLKCRLSGHIFVDSRSQPGVQVCVRCRHRQAFESLQAKVASPEALRDDRRSPRRPGDPTAS